MWLSLRSWVIHSGVFFEIDCALIQNFLKFHLNKAARMALLLTLISYEIAMVFLLVTDLE